MDNFTNIEIKIKNIIWYGFSMIPYKNDVVHLKFVAIHKNTSKLYSKIYPILGYYGFTTTRYKVKAKTTKILKCIKTLLTVKRLMLL